MRRALFAVALAALLAGPAPAAAQSTEAEPGQAPGWTFTPSVIVTLPVGVPDPGATTVTA